ncbi:MAG: class II aldolase/adducin family protein [Pseudomonadota bacterium]
MFAQREDFALAHRIIAYEDMHEGVGNHLSLMTSDDSGAMFVTPGHKYFADIQSDDVLLMDREGAVVASTATPNQAAWCLHKPIHDARRDARCVIHLHALHATALMMREGGMLDTRGSQAAAMFHQHVAYYDSYDGVLRENEEGEAMARVLGERSVLVLRNHGFIVVGPSLDIALELAYYFERACRLQLLAQGSGERLNQIPEDMVAEICKEERLYLGRYLPGLRAYFQSRGL